MKNLFRHNNKFIEYENFFIEKLINNPKEVIYFLDNFLDERSKKFIIFLYFNKDGSILDLSKISGLSRTRTDQVVKKSLIMFKRSYYYIFKSINEIKDIILECVKTMDKIWNDPDIQEYSISDENRKIYWENYYKHEFLKKIIRIMKKIKKVKNV